MLEWPVPEGLHSIEGTHNGTINEELRPVGRIYVGKVYGSLSPVGDSMLKQGV